METLMLEQDQITPVTADKGGRTYKIDGETELFLPSVTTVINFVVNKPALPPWAYGVGIKSTVEYIKTLPPHSLAMDFPSVGEVKLALQERGMTHKDEMQRGGDRGIDVHNALEGIVKGTDYDYSTENITYVNTLRQWISDYEPEWIHSEFKVASIEYGFAGQFDGVCIINRHPPRRRHESLVGKTCLIDVKTNGSGAVYPETHFPQVEAYAKAYEEMGGDTVDAKVVVGIGPEGKYSTGVSYARFETFKCILDLYNEMQWMKNNNPNKRS